MNYSTKRFALVACTFLACQWTGGNALSAPFKIVTQQTAEQATVATHEISSRGAILGISEYGGGYINRLFVPGIGEIMGPVAARYGRGGQVAIRDRLHSGKYNPTQAGFTDTAGTNVVVEQQGKVRLYVPPRPVSLWHGDRQYDFTEWENLAPDTYANDGGNSDQDGIDESRLEGKQAAEITSEFDLAVAYEDASQIAKIAAFRISYEFRFIREPGHAISQFGKGTPVYRSQFERADRSRKAPAGNHPSAPDSLTDVIYAFAIRGDKRLWDPQFAFYPETASQLKSERPTRIFTYPILTDSKFSRTPLVVVSRSSDPRTGPAIGFYHPRNRTNELSVVGKSVDNHQDVYEDDRGTTANLLANLERTPNMWRLGVTGEITGLLNRRETPRGVYEAFRGESYILIGTPQEILEAANAIHRFSN